MIHVKIGSVDPIALLVHPHTHHRLAGILPVMASLTCPVEHVEKMGGLASLAGFVIFTPHTR